MSTRSTAGAPSIMTGALHRTRSGLPPIIPPPYANLISPRASDQLGSPDIISPQTPVEVELDTDIAPNKDQDRRKPRFSTSSLPDVDW